mmetsp:Transcript_60939/g.108257  ORF Transcript_60939/g.108257 Transcript_60939/m.108257 type:complete len:834 (+) Transcript_60939:94-2595(+)|eukprot:CAMPEP_0197630810 /NCGR_PEP_ID=MMETSP1338-20131121/8171_1 /TAXON_ID=43686 ORGANISM="Pelagodinium beii, Strain RCC1491" /NCGR_SAMPLE_ID=MMETSP1338 /ASSEMBLY_ACC=CAM_ASM_000754 /LENGTH=833 /DNA_ID=CAMNT_0043202115 /DNA_START=92 /DNA_END=2593 /DNA_ORIENTATION=-
MLLNEDKIRCGSLAGGILALLATGAALPALFLVWWDHGSAKELFNLDDAPSVSSSIWTFEFHNPAEWVIYPVARDPSSWDEYCASNDQRIQAQAAAATLESSDADNAAAEDEEVENASNSSNATLTMPAAVASVTTISPSATSKDDPLLPPGSCEVIQLIRTLTMMSPSFGGAAAVFFWGSRLFTSLTLMLAAAALSVLCTGAVGASIVLASLLSTNGLLTSPAVLCCVGAICLGIAAASMGTWAATKAVGQVETRALPLKSQGGEAEEDSEDERVLRRQEFMASNPYAGEQAEIPSDDSKPRIQKLRQSERKDARKQNREMKRLQKIASGQKTSVGSMLRDEPSERQKLIIAKLLEEAKPQTLERILRWGEGEGEGGRFGKEIPDIMMRKAFEEVDNDGSGSVSLEEFMDAVGRCGLAPSRGAFEGIMMEVDKDFSGDIDVQEFIRFFRTLEDALREGEQRANQEQLCGVACACCFGLHIIFLFFMVVAASLEDNSGEVEVTGVKKAERELMNTLIQCIIGTFCLLFYCVIGVPMFQLTAGASSQAWIGYFVQAWEEWKENRRAAKQAKLEEVEKDDPKKKKKKAPKKSPNKSRSTRKQNTTMEVVDEEEEADDDDHAHGDSLKSPESDHEEDDGPMMGHTFSTAEDVEAPAFDRQLTEDTDEDHHHGKKSAKSSKRQTKKAKTSNFEDDEKSWFKKMFSGGSPASSPKGKNSRKSKKSETGWQPTVEGQYNPDKYQAANMKAAQHLVQPVSTFTPTQVRSLMYRPPEMTLPLPPQEVQATLHLPGTPDRYGLSPNQSFHSRSNTAFSSRHQIAALRTPDSARTSDGVPPPV